MTSALARQLALLPEYLGQHVLLSLTALGLGLLLSLPLAFLVTRVRVLQAPVLTIASVIQTIPGLALLALMVPLLRRIGFLPAVLALILYSMLPIIRNTVTGIQAVDAQLVEAGRALGMTSRQLLFRVQLPLAMPVIIAGIRTAAVWVVGMATLSTPVGATSLGNYIFSGLQTQNYTAVLVGCIAAAMLALVLDGLIRILEIGAARRSRKLLIAGTTMLAAFVIAALIPGIVVRGNSAAVPAVVIGAKTFTEQYILADLVATRLRNAGLPSTTLTSLGSTVAFDALLAGKIDCYIDYSGTIWSSYMGGSGRPDRDSLRQQVSDWLRERHGITVVIPLGFENTYVLAMRSNQAGELGLQSIADLTALAPRLKLGTDYEFMSRPEWPALQQQYGLEFSAAITMDSTLMYEALAENQVDVITAYSTDGRIPAYDLSVLDDVHGAFPPYDALLLVSPAAVEKWPDLIPVLQGLRNRLTAQAMRSANRKVDLDGMAVSEAAAELAAVLAAREDSAGAD